MLDLLKGAGSAAQQTLHPSVVRIDGGTQMRAELNATTIEEYAVAMQAGAQFPAIVVYYDGSDYWLGDGFHRLAARRKLLEGAVECEVRSGTRRDAVLCAAGANAAHGLRRTNADKRRAVEALLRDEEWAQWSDREIARRCAVDHKTVGALRGELSGEFPQIGARTAHRNGAEYMIATSGIGAANQGRKRSERVDDVAARERRLEATVPAAQPTNQPATTPSVADDEQETWGRDKRLPLAMAMRDVIGDVLRHMSDYGTLTGCYTDIPPAERALKKMRDELQGLIDALR